MYLRVSAKRHVVMVSTISYLESFSCVFVPKYHYLNVVAKLRCLVLKRKFDRSSLHACVDARELSEVEHGDRFNT
jgi:hypothetical protein